MTKVLVISHFNFSEAGPIHGPTNSVCDYLRFKKNHYRLIAHPLYSGSKSYVEKYGGTKVTTKSVGKILKAPFVIKVIREFLLSIRLIGDEAYEIGIGVDPHSAMTMLLLKITGKVKNVVYYSVDYAAKRFDSFILNFFYHLVDRLAILFSDRVWNVSTRIYKKRISQGVSKKRNFLVPNSPIYDDKNILPMDKVDRFRICFVTGTTHLPVFSNVIKAFKNVVRKYPKASLQVIGNTKKPVVQTGVRYLGQLEHGSLLSEVAKSGVGLALYTNDFAWTKYGDSMKARDYMSVGVPVMISDVVSTAEDIRRYKAGVVAGTNPIEIEKGLTKIFSNKTFWMELRENAIHCARENDFRKVLDEQELF